MIDIHATLLGYLQVRMADVLIFAGRSVPPDSWQLEDGSCIVFRVRGGFADYSDALLVPSVQFKCYGVRSGESSEVESDALYRRLYDELHNGRGVSITHAESEALGELLSEPDTGWHYVLCAFQAMVRNIAID